MRLVMPHRPQPAPAPLWLRALGVLTVAAVAALGAWSAFQPMGGAQ